MTQRPVIHMVSKAELATTTGGVDGAWNDPEGLCRLTPEKRAALLENPLSRDDQDPVQLFATQDRLVIGKVDLLMGQFCVPHPHGHRVVPTLWTSAYYVPEAFRTTLVGIMLLVEVQRLNPTVSACGVSQMALPVFQRLKWLHFALPRHVIVLRSRPVVARWLGSNLPAAIASNVVDTPLRLQRHLWGSRADRRLGELQCELVEGMHPELDEQLHASCGGVHAHRSAAWVNWLLAHRFTDDHSFCKALFYVYDSDRQVVGYFIIKTRFYANASRFGFRDLTLGSLGDWMILAPARLRVEQLLLFAVRALEQRRPDVIELCLDPGRASAWLHRWGFPRVGELDILVRASSKSALREPQLARQEAWRLRPVEGDHFFS